MPLVEPEMKADLSCSLRSMPCDAPLLFFEMPVEPFDRQARGAIAGFPVDAVVRDARDHDMGLRPAGALVGELGMHAVVEELFLLHGDEQHGAIANARHVVDG